MTNTTTATTTTTAPGIIVPGASAEPIATTIHLADGTTYRIDVDTADPRGVVAAAVARRATVRSTAGPVAAGPGTPGAIVTHAGNYIIPAATDGTMTCRVCHRNRPETKFPTRPARADGVVVRDDRCRECRDDAAAARRAARDTAAVAVPPPAAEPVPDAPAVAADRRMANVAARAAADPAAFMADTAVAAAATVVAMPDSMFVGSAS